MSNSSTVKVGGAVTFHVDMALSPRTISTFSIDAISANNSYLSVCRLAVESQGDNIPCVSEQAETQYLAYGNITKHDRAAIDFLNIANIGITHPYMFTVIHISQIYLYIVFTHRIGYWELKCHVNII